MLTQEELKRMLHYESETGIFTWKINKRGPVKRGDVAGKTNGRGYRVIKIDGAYYYAHRLAWFYITGNWPKETDHINRVKTDNRMVNLREVTHSLNNRNRGSYSKRLPTQPW